MNTKTTTAFQALNTADKQAIFNEVAAQKGLPVTAAAEKDWWVVRTLELVFSSSIAPHTVFKGGTSLSKAWNLIDRFSEDIDLALDRKFLGFDKEDSEMTGAQVLKLRKKSFGFISEVYFPEIKQLFKNSGFNDVTLKLGEVKSTDDDPITIEIYYPPVTERVDYIRPRVLIEVGGRSLIEPFESRSFSSFVGERFKDRPFADVPIAIPTVIPERTFLEKIFLLHEEFQRTAEEIKVDRRSRHLYDLEKLMDTEFADRALNDVRLYETIVEHRKRITPVRGIDYANHSPQSINIIPPDEIIGAWEKDYKVMSESMFFNDSLSFEKLIKRLNDLKSRINILNHKSTAD
jgi:predicted nucleotidyltransferase component of viral defense system